MSILLQLYWSMFQIGLFSIGGGYVALPLIQHQIVDIHGWMTLTEFTDIITIAEMTPGPIAINSATFVGLRMGGAIGAVVATVGCVTAPVIIVLLLAKIYYKYRSLSAMQHILSGIRPGVVGMIASAGLGIILLAFFGETKVVSLANTNFYAMIMFALGLLGLRKLKLGPIPVMLISGLVGVVLFGLIGL